MASRITSGLSATRVSQYAANSDFPPADPSAAPIAAAIAGCCESAASVSLDSRFCADLGLIADAAGDGPSKLIPGGGRLSMVSSVTTRLNGLLLPIMALPPPNTSSEVAECKGVVLWACSAGTDGSGRRPGEGGACLLFDGGSSEVPGVPGGLVSPGPLEYPLDDPFLAAASSSGSPTMVKSQPSSCADSSSFFFGSRDLWRGPPGRWWRPCSVTSLFSSSFAAAFSFSCQRKRKVGWVGGRGQGSSRAGQGPPSFIFASVISLSFVLWVACAATCASWHPSTNFFNSSRYGKSSCTFSFRLSTISLRLDLSSLAPVTKGFCSSSSALGLWSGSFCKQRVTKSWSGVVGMITVRATRIPQ
mmetsp:Transcript_76505/g.219402  ORF Transcript_76505/g.219402 Transcript_76505/m.219402 type:complete len:360 (+) Transcript_76505:1720-2799(+)